MTGDFVFKLISKGVEYKFIVKIKITKNECFAR